MVPTPRRAPGLHRVLHIHRHVVSKRNPSAAILFFIHVRCAFVHVAPCFCSGAWAASFMKWSPGGLFSLDRPWRTSFTSYSASSVSRHIRWTPPFQLCYFAVYYDFAVGEMFLYVHRLRTSFHLQMRSAGTPTEESWPGITTSEEFKTYNFPQYQAEPLVSHAPRHVFEFPLPHLAHLKMHFRILFCTNKHNLAILFLCLALCPVTG